MNGALVIVLILCGIQESLGLNGQMPFPRRIIVENVKNYSSAGDPVIDVNHTFWRSLHLDSDDVIDNWRFGTADFVDEWFGFNLNNSVPTSANNGVRELINFIPGVNATLIPYRLTSNETYRIALDNYNPARQFDGWFQYGVGNIVAISVAPNVTAYYGGLSNTTKILNGHILSNGFWQQLECGADWSKSQNRERHYWQSHYPAFQVPSSQGLINPVTNRVINDQFIFLSLTDEQGNKGEAVTMARNTLDPLTGKRITKTTTTMNYPESVPVQYDCL